MACDGLDSYWKNALDRLQAGSRSWPVGRRIGIWSYHVFRDGGRHRQDFDGKRLRHRVPRAIKHSTRSEKSKAVRCDEKGNRGQEVPQLAQLVLGIHAPGPCWR